MARQRFRGRYHNGTIYHDLREVNIGRFTLIVTYLTFQRIINEIIFRTFEWTLTKI